MTDQECEQDFVRVEQTVKITYKVLEEEMNCCTPSEFALDLCSDVGLLDCFIGSDVVESVDLVDGFEVLD